MSESCLGKGGPTACVLQDHQVSKIHPTKQHKKRERKREIDRKAQRTSRERAKLYTAELEERIDVLCRENDNTALIDLMNEIFSLKKDRDRLRMVIEKAKVTFDANLCESTVQGGNFSAKTGSQETSIANDWKVCETISSHDAQPQAGTNIGQDMQSMAFEKSVDVLDKFKNPLLGTDSIPGQDYSDFWANSSYLDDLPSSAQLEITSSKANPLWTLQDPPMNQPPISSPSPAMRCRIWERCNQIYCKILDKSQTNSAKPSDRDCGTIIKAVKDGWAALSEEELRNPVFKVLKEIDQEMLLLSDPITRVAVMYHNQILLKFFLSGNERYLEQMPVWQRPLTSSFVSNNQLAIQFFPWPALRRHLLEKHSTYFATSDFALYFQRYFKFKWPFPFEDAYGRCAESGDYCMSRLFEYHHHNLRSWTIGVDFVERFSELAKDVIVSSNETNALSKTLDHSSTLSQECSHGTFMDTSSSHKTYSDLRLKFMDTELMEDLFLNIPRSE